MRVLETLAASGRRPPGRRPRRCRAQDPLPGETPGTAAAGPGRAAAPALSAVLKRRSVLPPRRRAPPGGAVAPAPGGSPGPDGARPQPCRHHSLLAPGGSGPSRSSRIHPGTPRPLEDEGRSSLRRPVVSQRSRGRAVPVGCSDTQVPESSKHGPHGPTWRRAGAPARVAALTGGGRLKGGMVSEQTTLRAAGPGSPSLRQPQALALPRA